MGRVKWLHLSFLRGVFVTVDSVQIFNIIGIPDWGYSEGRAASCLNCQISGENREVLLQSVSRIVTMDAWEASLSH